MSKHLKDHFHPHEGNDNHPHAYRKGSAIALALVVGLVLVVSALQTGYINRSGQFMSSVLPAVLVDLTNEDRTDNGLHSLEPNETLAEAAQMKANHMAEEGYFAHDAPDGTTPWEWFQEAGYTYRSAGENLAVNFADSEMVEDAWMNSPPHRKNILAEKFTEVGIATARGEYEGKETVFVVQMFGRPAQSELSERESNNESEDSTVAAASEDDENEEFADNSTASEEEDDPAEEEADEDPETEEADDSGFRMQDGVRVQGSNTSSPTTSTQGSSENREVAHQTQHYDDSQAAMTDDELVSTDTATTSTTTTDSESGTATPTAVAQVQGGQGAALTPQATIFEHLLSRPQLIFQTLIVTLASLIALALLISVAVEAKKHHIKQAGYSLMALIILAGVFYFGSNLLFPEPTIASQSDSRLEASISDRG